MAAFSEEPQPLNRKGKQEKSKNLKNLITRLKLSIIFIHFIFTSIKKIIIAVRAFRKKV